jgi:hypothetical protein
VTYGYSAAGTQTVSSVASCLRKDVAKAKRVNGSETLPMDEFATASVRCPAGSRVAGGGGIVSGATVDAIMRSSRPTDANDGDDLNDDGWSFSAKSLADEELTITVSALCVDQGRSKLRYHREGFDGGLATTDCPAGTRVLSGGFAGNVNVNLVGTVPDDGDDANDRRGDAWTIDIDSADSELLGGTAYVVCIDA